MANSQRQLPCAANDPWAASESTPILMRAAATLPRIERVCSSASMATRALPDTVSANIAAARPKTPPIPMPVNRRNTANCAGVVQTAVRPVHKE